VDLFLESEYQLAVVAGDALHGIAAVHGAASFAELAKLLFGSIRTENDVFGSNPQFAQESHPELMGIPHVEYTGNADPQLGAVFRLRR
jgi:hypothetical protein